MRVIDVRSRRRLIFHVIPRILSLSSAATLSAALLFTSCKPIPTTIKPKKQAEKKVEDEEESWSVETRFSTARARIVRGEFEKAADSLAKLDARTDIKQPLHNWITTFAGMAALFAGREPEARKLFAKLETRGPIGTAPGEKKLSDFFLDLGNNLKGEDVVPTHIANRYDRFNYEAIAFLIYALKNEGLKKQDEAMTYYRQFTTTNPEGSEPWMGFNMQLTKLRQVALDMLENQDEFEVANKAIAQAQAATTPGEKRDALEAAKASRKRIKGINKMTAALDKVIAEIEPQVKGMLAEKEKMLADAAEHDAQALPEAKKKRDALIAQFRFREAIEAISAPELKTEKAKAEQTVLTQRSQFLENFQRQLITDLNANGYPDPVARKSGPPVSGGIGKADEQKIYVKNGTEWTPVPWLEVAPDFAYKMARSFIPDDMPPELAAHRRWQLGAYAMHIGKKEEAMQLLNLAAEAMPVFKEGLPLMTGPEGGQ